jgi:hypothetical protein
MNERICIVADGPEPEWARLFIRDTSDDTFFIAANAITADREELVHRRAIQSNEPVIIKNDRVYVPVRWLAKEYPQTANICAALERRAHNSARFNQRESTPTVVYNVRVQVAPIICPNYAERIKAVRGYLYGRAFVALEKVSDRRQMVALITDLRKYDTTITPVGFGDSKTVGGQHFAARCPECSAICSNFFMTAEFFENGVRCQFAACKCDYPNIECRLFDYHPVSLRLGLDERQLIAYHSARAITGVPTSANVRANSEC